MAFTPILVKSKTCRIDVNLVYKPCDCNICIILFHFIRAAYIVEKYSKDSLCIDDGLGQLDFLVGDRFKICGKHWTVSTAICIIFNNCLRAVLGGGNLRYILYSCLGACIICNTSLYWLLFTINYYVFYDTSLSSWIWTIDS